MINPQINSHNKLWNTVHAQETREDVARLAMTVAKSLVGCPTPCIHRYGNGMQKAECSGVVSQCNKNLEYIFVRQRILGTATLVYIFIGKCTTVADKYLDCADSENVVLSIYDLIRHCALFASAEHLVLGTRYNVASNNIKQLSTKEIRRCKKCAI